MLDCICQKKLDSSIASSAMTIIPRVQGKRPRCAPVCTEVHDGSTCIYCDRRVLIRFLPAAVASLCQVRCMGARSMSSKQSRHLAQFRVMKQLFLVVNRPLREANCRPCSYRLRMKEPSPRTNGKAGNLEEDFPRVR